MPAPPSRAQTDAKNASVASKSKSNGGNNYGGINTSKGLGGTTKTNNSGNKNFGGINTNTIRTNSGNNNFGGINTNTVRTNSGGLLGGNNSNLAARIGAISRGPGSVAGVMPGASPLSQQRTLQTLAGGLLGSGRNVNPVDLQRLSQTVAGEAGREGLLGQTAVANTMLNRMALADQGQAKYMGGGNINDLMGQYDATGMRPGTVENSAFRNARLGTDALGEGIASIAGAASPNSKFNTTMPDSIRQATSFYNPKTSDPKWGGPQFAKLGNHVFGLPDEMAGQGGIVTAARGMPGQPPTQTASLSPAGAPPRAQTPLAETGPSMWEQYAPNMLKTAVNAIDENLVQPTQDQIEKYGGFERAGALARTAVAIMNFMPGGTGGLGPIDKGNNDQGRLMAAMALQKQQPPQKTKKAGPPINQASATPQMMPWLYPQYSQQWAGLPQGVGGYVKG